MESFYGGPKGKDFEIKQVFTSKYQMDRDLTKGWTSPIFPGDLVIVSYGLPSDTNYDVYKDEDLRAYGKSYNSTLWRKVFIDAEGTGSAGGLSYEMLASMTGNTPRIDITEPIVLDADQDPDVRNDSTDLDNVLLTFLLPQAQIIDDSTYEVLDCDQPPEVELEIVYRLDAGEEPFPQRTYYVEDEEDPSGYRAVVFGEGLTYQANTYYYRDVNHPIIRFALPQSQIFTDDNVNSNYIDADQNPYIEFDNTSNVNRPTLTFYLPVSQILQQGSTTILDADGDPTFSINSENVNRPVISFSLPQSQVMVDPSIEVVGPRENPSVTLNDDNINSPKLEFKLPKSARFYSGEFLGERDQPTYEETDESFSSYYVGDYYINSATGFIYEITAKDGNTCTFTYMACLQAPVPTVTTNVVDPYQQDEETQGYEAITPSVVGSDSGQGVNAWNLQFTMPKPIENYETEAQFVGVTETGSSNAEITGTSTLKFSFTIPRGSRLFVGTQVSDTTTSATIEGAKQGDIYLNAQTGDIYELSSNGTWIKNTGNLKGPVGEALNIVKSYTINETETLKDSLQTGVTYIEENYTEEITAEDIFSITWVEYETNQETSYWYYKAADGVWGRVQLTGGITNLIDNVYNDESDGEVANKTYSVHYVNSLIGGTVTEKDRQTYSANQIEELLSWGSFSDLIP